MSLGLDGLYSFNELPCLSFKGAHRTILAGATQHPYEEHWKFFSVHLMHTVL